MTVHRIIIFDGAGNALYGADLHHGSDHAAAWVEATMAKLADDGVSGCVAIEYDSDYGGDHARKRGISCQNLKLETRTRPNGEREIVSMYHSDTRVHEGRAHRVIASADTALQRTHQVRGKAIETRASSWRELYPRAWRNRKTKRKKA